MSNKRTHTSAFVSHSPPITPHQSTLAPIPSRLSSLPEDLCRMADDQEPLNLNEQLDTVVCKSEPGMLPSLREEQHLAKLRNDALIYSITIDAFPDDKTALTTHLKTSIGSILGIDDIKNFFVGRATINLFTKSISENRSSIVEAVKIFLRDYDFNNGAIPKKQYIKQLLQKASFARDRFASSNQLFSSHLFIQCFYKCLCRRRGGHQRLDVNQINQPALSLIFCVIFLKLSMMSDEREPPAKVSFSAYSSNDYFLLYKEMIAPQPFTKFTRFIDWPASILLVKRAVETIDNEITPHGVSNLNSLLE